MATDNVTTSSIHHEGDDVEFRLFNPHRFNVSHGQGIVDGTCIPVFGLFGILANLLVFLVLAHRNRTRGTTSIALLLQCLSGYDIIVASLSIWMFSIPALCGQLGFGMNYLNNIHPHLVPFLFPLLHMGITGSDYLNLAAAVERYIGLDRDFRARKPPNNACSSRNTWFYISVIFAFTVAFNLPVIWERKVVDVDGVLEVHPTLLSENAIYIKLYRLTLEFLVFKATPWFAFFILFLSLKDRLKYYFDRQVRRTLSIDQCLELMDSRIILGINGLFYIANVLPIYISLCHILLYHVSEVVERAGHLSIVINSSLKIFVYLILSFDFRESLRSFVSSKKKSRWSPWSPRRAAEFLDHAKVSAFVTTVHAKTESRGLLET